MSTDPADDAPGEVLPTNDDLPEEVDPATGWEFAARNLLKREAERAEQQTRDSLRPLRRINDAASGVPPRGSATEIRSAIIILERLAEIVEELEPKPADGTPRRDGERPTEEHDPDGSAVTADDAPERPAE